jgi:hypothetical protein
MINLDDLSERREADTTGCVTLKAFGESIVRVEKIKPPSEREGSVWRIHIKICDEYRVLGIANGDLMRGKTKFEDLFKSNFGFFLPYEITKKPGIGEQNPWVKFQMLLEQMAEVVEPVESVAWIDSEALLNSIASMDWTDDKQYWADKNKSKKLMLRTEHEGRNWYLMKSGDVSSIVKEMKLTTFLNVIGDTLNGRRIKRHRNPTLRINATSTANPWWFAESALMERGFSPEIQKTETKARLSGY